MAAAACPTMKNIHVHAHTYAQAHTCRHTRTHTHTAMRSMLGVEVYLHGATLTHWLRPDGESALKSHPASLRDFEGQGAIKQPALRLAFPQVCVGRRGGGGRSGGGVKGHR